MPCLNCRCCNFPLTYAADRLNGIAEAVATGGLIFVILGVRRPQDAPWMVAAWIGAAYWFTASTSFANPAITIARSFSDTFAGIRPADVPAFVAAQLVGALVAAIFGRFFFEENSCSTGSASNSCVRITHAVRDTASMRSCSRLRYRRLIRNRTFDFNTISYSPLL